MVRAVSCSFKWGTLTSAQQRREYQARSIRREVREDMKLTQLASSCEDGPCPTVWAIDGTDHVIIQGFTVDDAEALESMRLPDSETAVRIPMALLRQVARDYQL